MIWATRPGCHVDRAGCAWLVRRFIDAQAEFVFVEQIDDVPQDARAFDMPGAQLSHHDHRCTFEVMLAQYELDDAALRDIGWIIHEADVGDERYDAPEAAGLDVIIRGMALILGDSEVLRASSHIFDALYEYRRQANELGRLPS